MQIIDNKNNSTEDKSTFEDEVVCVKILKTQEKFLNKHLKELDKLKEKITRMKH